MSRSWTGEIDRVAVRAARIWDAARRYIAFIDIVPT